MSQHMDALAVANTVRLACAEKRREIASMDQEAARDAVSNLLRQPSDIDLRQQVDRLLQAIPGAGPRVAERWREQVHLPGRAPRSGRLLRVDDLTERQRLALADVVAAS